MNTFKSGRRALLLVCAALLATSCSEKQQTPIDVQSAPAMVPYDVSKIPTDAAELPAAGPLVSAAWSPIAGTELVTNGDFTAGLAGWTMVNYPGNYPTNTWLLHTGGPINGYAVPNPPSAPYAAVTTQTGGSSRILYQDVILPSRLCGVPQLSFQLFIGNRSPGGFYSPASLRSWVIPNQQFRADIVSPSADIYDVGSGVLQKVYQTQPGDPLVEGYKLVGVPLNVTPGSTIRLRFAEVDNQLWFNAGIDNVSLKVPVDMLPPDITLSVAPTTLWPVNHKMVKVATGIAASDDCDDVPAVVVSVTSNQAINGNGDGNTTPDWNVVANPDGTFDVFLRAERSGKESDRVYTITVTATDAAGNSATATGTVTVPHDQR